LSPLYSSASSSSPLSSPSSPFFFIAVIVIIAHHRHHRLSLSPPASLLFSLPSLPPSGHAGTMETLPTSAWTSPSRTRRSGSKRRWSWCREESTSM
jgi:hypothetical protein